MKQLLILSLLLVSTIVCGKGDFGIAIIFEKPDGFNEFEEKFLEGFIYHYKENKSHYTEYYFWDGNETITPLDQSIVKQDNLDQKPITIAVVVKFEFELFYPRSIKIPEFKIIDIVTSEILKEYKYSSSLFSITKECYGYPVEEGKKLSKAEKLESEIAIKDCYLRNARQDGKVFAGLSDFIRNEFDEPWKVFDYTLKDKKYLESLKFTATNKAKISKRERLFLYQKSSHEGIDLFVHRTDLFLISSNKEFSVARPSFKRQDFTQFLESEIVIVRDEKLIYNLNHPNAKTASFLVDEEDEGKVFTLSEILYRIPNFKVMKRGYEYPLEYFSSKYSNENFLDHQIELIQNKQVGAQFIIEQQKHGIQITDIKTSRVVTLDSGTLNQYGLGSYITPTVLNACIEATGIGLKVEKVLEEKNGKTAKFLGHFPLSFNQTRHFDIIVRKYENVSGRLIPKDEMIGRCYWTNKISEELAEFKVSKGGKALAEALQNNDELVFKISLDRIQENIEK